jgi:hypothetical protein
VALRTNTTIINSYSSTVAHTHRKASSSILFAATTLLTEAATSNNRVPIVDFQALDHKVSHLHHHKGHVEDISATYNGQRLAQSAVDHIRISQAAIRTPSKLRQLCLISHHENLSPQLSMKMTTRSDPQRIYKWRMKQKNPNQDQAENMVIISKRMLPNSASLSSRNRLQLLQLSLRQI